MPRSKQRRKFIRKKLNLRAMQRKKYAIISAGGSGSRMGAPLPKQFLKLGTKAILQITIEKFITAEPDIKIIVVLPQAHQQWWKDYCYSHNFTCPQTIVDGGLTRFHSVSNALEKVPDGALVAVHDGVRPLITAECIRRLFEVAETERAVVPVVPCVDTLKPLQEGEGGRLKLIDGVEVDRSKLFAAQTPQIFCSEVLKQAYSQPFDTKFTDDASVLEKQKTDLTYVMGERLNVKITTQEDLLLARAIMSL